ncbi:hypothetical protein KM176_16635 [Pseudooceanicola sp. CBS1P-1]|uniref:Uncharacterized protein n=1 Tax=Pseudooceanicola albus TaxID=2692189 RepID=A0A6L7G4P2_9RHOB|nr:MULTISPECIES: hypothetical protein [Pseudooceanicola]MBT9385503.1 hypothetical protein [Pseudooceanicola endophyticus]MXN19085.1 hypothetical protein [Pseudooceanicola albus]
MPDNKTIIDSADLMEVDDVNIDEESFADLTATKQADPSTMDFYVQMRGYTMSDFETMVVHAAAAQLISGRNFQREIKEEAAVIATNKVTAELEKATKDVMSIVVSKRGKEDVTLSQMIGMEAKDYLTQLVDPYSGEPKTDNWGARNIPRVQYLAGKYLRDHFKGQIDGALKDLISEVRAEISKQIAAAIAAEREKFAQAIGYEIKKTR